MRVLSSLPSIVRRSARPSLVRQCPANWISTSERFRFWSGASGKRYVHSIYNLLECPELPQANFVLVRRDADGRRTVMAIGRLTNASMTLNLAELRQRGAQLGANEVHVHLLAAGPEQAKMIEFDLRTGQYQEGAFGPVSSVHH